MTRGICPLEDEKERVTSCDSTGSFDETQLLLAEGYYFFFSYFPINLFHGV